MTKLTLKQKAQIYCIKHGHANYITMCFGYVHCGRCEEQIGDTLAGIFDTSNSIFVGHKCKTCDKLKRKLSSLDKKILSRLEKNKDDYPEYEIILKGLIK